MLEVQSFFHYAKMLDNDRKRPPLLDISNKHLPAKKHKQERPEEGSARHLTPSLAPPPQKADHSSEQDVTLPLLKKLNNITRELSSPPRKEATPLFAISHIPIETLMCILSFLPECSDVLNTRLVCTGWDKLLRDKCMRKFVYESDFLRQNEECYRIASNYMKPHFQKEINPHMRTILVDWLVEVADEFQFQSETIFLCINYLDRYLAVQQVPRSKLQLLGVVCMLIAAKFEEIQVPRVEEFVFISDNTCTRDEVFTMEVHVLAKLKYFLAAVTSRSFLSKYLTTIRIPEADKLALDTLANFFIELALLEYGVTKYPASLVAASALCLALQTLHFCAWTHTLECVTQYSIVDKDMQDCVAELHTLFVQCPLSEFQAIYKKYQERGVFAAFPKPALTLARTSSPYFALASGIPLQ